MEIEVLTVKEAMEYLGISYSSIRRMIRRKDLKVAKIARNTIRILKSEVEKVKRVDISQEEFNKRINEGQV